MPLSWHGLTQIVVVQEHSVEVSEDTVKGAVRILMRQSKDKAIKFLQTMPPLVAERALAVIEVSYYS